MLKGASFVGAVAAAALSMQVLPVAAQLEEVIVTAQKRSESLQDVPIAVTAFTGESMRELGITNASDLVVFTPGLSMRQQSGSNINYFLRGVGTNDIHLTAAPAVGQYFDEITLTSGFHARTSLFDMNRVEVLKGPQNTLFGLNTTGGAVSYFSNRPEIGAGSQGSLDARLGNYGLVNLEGAVGFDLGANAAMRLAGVWNQSDGAFESQYDGKEYGDDDTQALRAQVLWRLGDATDALLNVHYGQSENNGSVYKVLGTRSPDGSGAVCAGFNPGSVQDFDDNTPCITVPPPAAGGQGPGQPGVDPSFADWEDVAMDVGGEDLETYGAFFKLNHEFSWASFTSITAFDNLQFTNTNDLDGAQLGQMINLQQDDRDTFQQELRLVSLSDGDFRWIGGIYYLDEESQSYTGLRSNLIGGWAILPNVQLDHTRENVGVYAQGEYDLTEALTLTVGTRWSDETIEGDYLPSRPRVVGIADTTPLHAAQVNALVAEQNPGTPAFDANGFELARQLSQKLENDDVGFTVKLDYQLADDSMLYASFARGFKGAALDIRAAYALVPVGNVEQGLEDARLEPESLDAWEVGFKGTYLDNRLQLDAALFYYSYENLQQFITFRGIPTLDNAPESESYGFDANLKFANETGFFAQLGVSYLETEVTDASDSEFIEGAPLAGSPEWSVTALATQDFSVGSGVLTLMANISYTDEQATETLTSATQPVEQALTVDGYTLVNTSLVYRFGDAEQFKVGLFANNLLDEHFCVGLRTSDTANLAQPGNAGYHHGNLTCMVNNTTVRTYGVSVGYSF
ncbi:TonB-dependent receptor [Pseudohaliea rubra]|uniref:TonB-dependent receptor n=1 Tax=Pseudohaliea rubra DSM 19751 TaxID=1265313 RepID=A0A095VSZ2_9GAMM|nr:TonB-dependent receptor [Pseudohaliea rubra]KGE04567.1 TonB-dependent receptor [Pseudohaliea rubra DSM 19751]